MNNQDQRDQQDQSIDDLQAELNKVDFVLNGLENYEPFDKFIEFFKDAAKATDDEWFKLASSKDDLFQDLKAHKLAYNSVLQFIDSMKFAREGLVEEIEQMNEVEIG